MIDCITLHSIKRNANILSILIKVLSKLCYCIINISFINFELLLYHHYQCARKMLTRKM